MFNFICLAALLLAGLVNINNNNIVMGLFLWLGAIIFAILNQPKVENK